MDNLIVVMHGTEDRIPRPYSYTAEALDEMNRLTTGQVFYAVARANNKRPHQYPRWISFRNHRGEFEAVRGILESMASDLEKLNAVADWLGEEKFG